MPISNRSKLMANPCSEAATRHNWDVAQKHFGQVRTNENDQEPRDLIDTIPTTPTMAPVLGGGGPLGDPNDIQMHWNIDNPYPGLTEDGMAPVFVDGGGITWGFPGAVGGTAVNRVVLTDARLNAGKLQVYKQTLKFPSILVADTGWVDVITFATQSVVTNVAWGSPDLTQSKIDVVVVSASGAGSSTVLTAELMDVVTDVNYDTGTHALTYDYAGSVYVFANGTPSGPTTINVADPCT
jgi:hypothetical protein